MPIDEHVGVGSPRDIDLGDIDLGDLRRDALRAWWNGPTAYRDLASIVFFLVAFACLWIFVGLPLAYREHLRIEATAKVAHTGEGFVVLAMVKNEERVLPRMIQSVLQTLPKAKIFLCDTGSGDGTLATAAHYAGAALLPVYRSRLNWTNFEVNRNECMDAVTMLHFRYGTSSEHRWLLLLDADREVLAALVKDAGTSSNAIQYDANLLAVRTAANTQHDTTALLSAQAVPCCRYHLWTHEILECNCTRYAPGRLSSQGITIGHYDALYLYEHYDGANRGDKLQRDSRLLREWLNCSHNAHSEDRARAWFYLGESYRGLGANYSALAREAYERNLETEIYLNYRFYSRYAIALCVLHDDNSTCAKNRTAQQTYEEVERLMWAAIDEYEGVYRWEPYYVLAFLAERQGRYNRCIAYTAAAMRAPALLQSRMPLFVERDAYDSGVEEQHAKCLWHVGRPDEARAVWRALLAKPASIVDRAVRDKIAQNLKSF